MGFAVGEVTYPQPPLSEGEASQGKKGRKKSLFLVVFGKAENGIVFHASKSKVEISLDLPLPFLAVFAAPVFGFAYPARLWLIFNGSTQHLQWLPRLDHLY